MTTSPRTCRWLQSTQRWWLMTATALVAILVLVLLAAWAPRSPACSVVFGVIVPYAAIVLFLGGFVYRVVRWARAPVPFRIPTTCGQQKTLPWIQYEQARQPAHHAGRDRADGPRGPVLPVPVPQHQGGDQVRRQRGLRAQQVAVGGGAGLPLVVPGDLHPAPALLHRAGARLRD